MFYNLTHPSRCIHIMYYLTTVCLLCSQHLHANSILFTLQSHINPPHVIKRAFPPKPSEKLPHKVIESDSFYEFTDYFHCPRLVLLILNYIQYNYVVFMYCTSTLLYWNVVMFQLPIPLIIPVTKSINQPIDCSYCNNKVGTLASYV